MGAGTPGGGDLNKDKNVYDLPYTDDGVIQMLSYVFYSLFNNLSTAEKTLYKFTITTEETIS